MKTKTFITAALAFASAFAFSARFPASIQKLNKDYLSRQVTFLLENHYAAVDALRSDLIHRHLSYFKKTNQPSNADFNALEEDLKHFFRVDALTKPSRFKKSGKAEVPYAVMNILSDSEKEQAAGFAKDFNSNIFPHLYQAVVTKDKKSVISNLQKWATLNKNYIKFFKTCLKAHKKRQS